MIEILKFEMVNKGALIARFNVKLHKWGGVVIKECAYFESGDKKWVNFPARQYEIEGKKKYAEYIAFEDRDLNDKFKASIMAAVLEFKSKQSPAKSQEPDFDEMPF